MSLANLEYVWDTSSIVLQVGLGGLKKKKEEGHSYTLVMIKLLSKECLVRLKVCPYLDHSSHS
jgi:hypothetical protein